MADWRLGDWIANGVLAVAAFGLLVLDWACVITRIRRRDKADDGRS
jgi:hypothetical protein